MSDFEPAGKKLIADEGGYVNDPQDPGGETNFGISRRWLNAMGLSLNLRTMTEEQALELYRRYWWDEYHYGLIEDQDLADELLSMSVVAGPGPAHVCLQRALCAVARNPKAAKTDGVLGPATRAAVEQANPCCLAAAYRSEQAGYFRDLDKPRFEAGWAARAYR